MWKKSRAQSLIQFVKMCATWLKLLLTAWLLGECQSSLPDEFAPLATTTTSHEAGKVNNVTLTPPGRVAQGKQDDFDRDLEQDDPLTPHAAPSSQRKLSRGKRFVAFPQGSSASGAVCLTTGVIGNPNLLYLSLGINWGVAYDLPNITWVLQNAHGWTTKKSAKAQIKRRHRRELYSRLETMIDSHDLWSPPTLMTMMERADDSAPSTSSSAPGSLGTSSQLLHRRWQRVLSRPKRYLSFPEGSSLSVAVCFTVGIIGNPYYGYNSFGLNWGVAYDLPNTTWVLQHLHGFATHPVGPAILRRRSRSAIYQRIETIVDNMGYNGRDCVLRTLCESRQYFQRTKMSMVGEMLRTIFSLPKQRIFTRELHENSDIFHYDQAYRNAHNDDCTQYHCHFSLLELAFGKYTTPPKNYYA
ncbi:uncharacterized protein LOC108026107 isoform X1 [Drosophila biarmipes]|uniref:uncharacterized protein LOC108026107 isoform X1 n=1 Tax=Drosophila biarmipes TaxID=125945 RepID=UPI0021CCC709|nr:uncharacterized protein LOC108026107 isoform X1 [Drosophila biarmipes]